MLALLLHLQIHESVVFSNRNKRTLLDKVLIFVSGFQVVEPCYPVADVYYASSKVVKGLLGQNHDLIARYKSNCVAYHRAPRVKKPDRGRPRLYGQSVKLNNLFRSALAVTTVKSPLYNDSNVRFKVRSIDLLWKPAGRLVRFVLAKHPTRAGTIGIDEQ